MKRKNSDLREPIDWQSIIGYAVLVATLLLVTSPIWLVLADLQGQKHQRIVWEGEVVQVLSGISGGAFAIVSNGENIFVVEIDTGNYFPSEGDRVIRAQYKGGMGRWGRTYTHFLPQ